MRIGEIAEKTGFTPDTIRWYEKIGLIQLDSKSRGKNNYRVYDESTIEKLLAIRQMKSLGFTLREVEGLMSLENDENLNCDSVSPMIDSKIDLISQQILELESIKDKLIRAKKICKGDCAEVIYR